MDERVEIVERKVESLQKLPARMDAFESQLVQLREEVGAEFSAVRTEMRTGFSALRAEIKAGDEETRRFMRVLHEDVIARIALIGEGQPRTRKKSSPPKT